MERYVFPEEKRAALENLRQPFAVFQIVNGSVVTLLLSDGFLDMYGYSGRDEAMRELGGYMFGNIHPDDVARIAEVTASFASNGGRYETIYRSKKKNGQDYSVIHATGECVEAENGVFLGHVWFTDEGIYTEDASAGGSRISKTLSNALHEQSIIKASKYDYLTGLPSMTHFFELAEPAKQAMAASGAQPMQLYIDLSGMKFFNAKHGFAEGDKMLKSFGKLLAREFGGRSCCRIGADHFIAIAVEKGLEEKLRLLFRDFSVLYDDKTPPVHVGIYSYGVEDVHVSTACDRAKLACGALKGSYSSAFAYYNAELRKDAVMKQYIIENLDTALREKWIKVYIQPIIRSVNEKVCDVEALARWIDPAKGLLPPNAFIPVLEETGLIYKLDLYMLDEVISLIKRQEEEGFCIVPHSINLSRSDFDACDIVEEIRKRVDGAGIPRKMITIEITESIIGGDFEFMKAQIGRFQSLGFPVWMDDFGSGYSSLDVLQSIKFDLLKFDMSFMRKLGESEDSKVILTELMRMATSLGVDTVCEGVETETQVRFLQEIGCSKMQGYYYSRPLSFEDILEKRRFGTQILSENPEESDYYESIGRVNLYDLSVIAQGEEYSLQNTFDTLPMGIIETRGPLARFVRCNQSYRDFMKRFFGVDLSELGTEFGRPDNSFMQNVYKTCCEMGQRAFYYEKMPDGSLVHSFARRISINPVNGDIAVVVAVLSVSDPNEETSSAEIARALAADYYDIYVIDLDADTYYEYSSASGVDELALEGRGNDFFGTARKQALTRIYEGDRETFLSRFTVENVLADLDTQGVFSMTYRLMDSGEPVYVNLKITRMQGYNRLILGVSVVDAQIRQQEEEERLRQEKIALGRIAALSANYIVLYTIDPETDHYIQYSPSREFAEFGLATQGEDFFRDVQLDAPKAIDPRDMERHLRVLTKENMLREIREKGLFVHSYRLLINGIPIPAMLKATLSRENGDEKIILGVSLLGGDGTESTDERWDELIKENSRLKQEAETSRKIAELRESVSALLENMPGLTFSKDVATGKYIACNTAFAAYAKKETPEDVVGLTDFEIFDRATAEHFVEDDKRALATDEPYVFFEDVKDAAGSSKQFKTTKLKFVDGLGRQCLLGLSQDVTDMVRVERENASTKEAFENMRSAHVIFTRIAQALARGITDLYYVNMDTDEFIEFHTDDELGVLTEARRGNDFFEGCRRDVKLFVHEEDQAKFVEAMDRDFLNRAFDREKVFEFTYRRIKNGRPFYVSMKVSRIEEDPRIVVLAVSDIDELMKKRLAEEKMIEERVIYARLHALTGNFICVYVVDPETGDYREFSATEKYVHSFSRAKAGTDFFNTVREGAQLYNHPDDLERFNSAFTQENVMAEVRRSGSFTLGYRLLMSGRSVHVQMKCAMVEEKEGPRLIVGLNDIDMQVRQEEELSRRLAQAQSQANIDALTGVQNKHSYLETETRMDRLIADRRQRPFGIVMLDVNDLKKVNDTCGHQAGDQYLRDASAIMTEVFKNSRVFRVGGDEFAVIVKDEDYENAEALLAEMRRRNLEAIRSGGIVIACGMARFENDPCVAPVFERADHSMYADKNDLKNLGANPRYEYKA